jgi:hypothetical protein
VTRGLLVLGDGRSYRVVAWDGRTLADCPTFEAAMAARRLLGGAL